MYTAIPSRGKSAPKSVWSCPETRPQTFTAEWDGRCIPSLLHFRPCAARCSSKARGAEHPFSFFVILVVTFSICFFPPAFFFWGGGRGEVLQGEGAGGGR